MNISQRGAFFTSRGFFRKLPGKDGNAVFRFLVVLGREVRRDKTGSRFAEICCECNNSDHELSNASSA